MPRHVRHELVAVALLATAAHRSIAQGPPITADRPETMPAGAHCLVGSVPTRFVTGGVLGAWVGFVAAKIRVSDWNDASHTASANRLRNQMTIGGALFGAISASVVHISKSCTPHAVAPEATSPERQPITADEIVRSGVSGSVYDVVNTLRRNWLNVRGLNSVTEATHIATIGGDTLVQGEPQLVVYLDNMKLGTISELRTLTASGVTSIRFYDPAQANYLWGPGHTHGAIQVMTVER